MERHTRRAVLGSVAATFGAVGGCAGVLERGPRTPDDGPADTPGDTPTTTPASLTLEAVEPPLAGPEVQPRTVTVYPESMALALRRAARIEGTYRSHATAFVEASRPFWTEYGRVRVTGPDAGSEPKGVYEMTAEGGVRYELLVGAGEVSDPEAPGAPVSELEGERRELALAAVRNERPRIYPETELGEWVRAEWFDDRWEYDGTVYRGKEIQQTDAAFFSDQVWATVRMRETRAEPQVVFELRAPGDAVRETLDPVLADWSRDETSTEVADPPAPVVEYLTGADLVATHTTVFEARFD